MPLAASFAAEYLRDCDVLWFTDNEAACASLVRGASRQVDVGAIAGLAHLLCAHLGCRVWFEWIDSESNPADALSRDGLDDHWTRQQAWVLQEVTAPEWDSLFHEQWRALEILKDIGESS